MDRHREHDLRDLRGHPGEVDLDGLVVALALTGEVVARVLHGAVGAREVVVEDEVLVGDDLSGVVAEQRAGVEVVVRAGGGPHVPAQADQHGREAGRLLAQRDIAALGEGNSHVSSCGPLPRIASGRGQGRDLEST